MSPSYHKHNIRNLRKLYGFFLALLCRIVDRIEKDQAFPNVHSAPRRPHPTAVGNGRLGDNKRMFSRGSFFASSALPATYTSPCAHPQSCNLRMVFRPNNHNGRIARLDYAFVDTSYKRTGKIRARQNRVPDLVVNRLGYTMRPDYDNRALVTGNRVQVLGYANPFFSRSAITSLLWINSPYV